MNELSYRRVKLTLEFSKFDEIYFCPSRAVIGYVDKATRSLPLRNRPDLIIAIARPRSVFVPHIYTLTPEVYTKEYALSRYSVLTSRATFASNELRVRPEF
jgi:hypothetical protein